MNATHLTATPDTLDTLAGILNALTDAGMALPAGEARDAIDAAMATVNAAYLAEARQRDAGTGPRNFFVILDRGDGIDHVVLDVDAADEDDAVRYAYQRLGLEAAHGPLPADAGALFVCQDALGYWQWDLFAVEHRSGVLVEADDRMAWFVRTAAAARTA